MNDPSSPLSSHSQPSEKKSSLKRPLLFGCLGILVVLALMIGGGIYWLTTSGKVFISDWARDGIMEHIEKSELPKEQQAALKVEIDRVAKGFQDGEIDFEELLRIIEGIEQSPAINVIKYYEAQGNPLDRPSITDAQRKAAMLTIKRFIYGVFEDQIPETAVEDIIDPFILDSSRGKGLDELQFRTDVSDEEIFAALEKAQKLADDAGVGHSNLTPDIARAVRGVVDRILAGRE